MFNHSKGGYKTNIKQPPRRGQPLKRGQKCRSQSVLSSEPMLFVCVSQISSPTTRCRNAENQEPDPNPPEPSPTGQPSESKSWSEELAAKMLGTYNRPQVLRADHQQLLARASQKVGGDCHHPQHPQLPEDKVTMHVHLLFRPTVLPQLISYSLLVCALLSYHLLRCSIFPGGKLQETIRIKDIITIALDHISDWEVLATYLGMSEAEIAHIRRSFPGEVKRQA